MSSSPDNQPPSISPVPDGVERPLWSVMIPAFNCAKYLPQTLESVLAQDPGPGQMQIEVVDDCSTKDDTEAVVREIGKGRVTFYRKPRNEGAILNFNTCIARSRGYLVHILHGDDYVLPGFYATVMEASRNYPAVGAFFVRSLVIEEDGTLDYLTNRLRFLEQPARNAGPLFEHNDLATPGAVIRRSFYEKHGGFIPSLVHCADWEMWIRGIQLGTGLFLNDALAVYRFFAGNDTSRLRRTGENFRDNLRLAAIWERQYKNFNRAHFEQLLSVRAFEQTEYYRRKNDMEAAAANEKIWQELTPFSRQLLSKLNTTLRKAVKRDFESRPSGQ